MKNYWSIDRIEGRFAVCENDAGITRKFLLDNLPFFAAEGMVFYEEGGLLIHDLQEENKRKSDIKKQMDRLFDKGE